MPCGAAFSPLASTMHAATARDRVESGRILRHDFRYEGATPATRSRCDGSSFVPGCERNLTRRRSHRPEAIGISPDVAKCLARPPVEGCPGTTHARASDVAGQKFVGWPNE